AEVDDPHVGVGGGEAVELFGRAVAATVVDEQDLVGAPSALEAGGQFPVELVQRSLFVEDGDDDRDLRAACALVHPPEATQKASGSQPQRSVASRPHAGASPSR